MFKNNLLLKILVSITLGLTGASAQALPKNMHLIDSNEGSGFAIYRSSVPSRDDVKQWCAMGISEVYVLSGDAAKNEFKYQSACPGLKVVYNQVQDAEVPLASAFLNQFDAWVNSAQVQGKKILFRCSCGCHRTGRLAAYYRMKYNGWSKAEAFAELKDLAKWMLFFPFLKVQVNAIGDYVAGAACTQKSKYCVKLSSTSEVLLTQLRE